MLELLTPVQMALADGAAINGGTPGITLMENAGAAVVDVFNEEFPDASKILVICGTGNNGGDGFIAARMLRDQSKDVSVFIFGDASRISGDAKLAFDRCEQVIIASELPDISKFDVVVDALFGAGLDRPVAGKAAQIVDAVNDSGKPIISVDLPSGINGATGEVMGHAVGATSTVTFFRYKPGHVLLPGRSFCGRKHLRQIGIEEDVLASSGQSAALNLPDLWGQVFPTPDIAGHKYDRGHSLVLSGPLTATGAARLMAGAALRVGSGLVTVASPEDAMLVNACHLTSIMLRSADTPHDIRETLADERFNCVALGPGMPPDSDTARMVTTVLAMKRRTVLDAGALSAFESSPDTLFAAIRNSGAQVVLTPHEGEFAKLFPEENKLSSKLERAKAASVKSGAVILLKGPDTVVASPSGEASIADNSAPWLATAGSGDVLSGIVTGLLAQGMPVFEATSAAVWLHGDAAQKAGPGMISSDLDQALRLSIRDLHPDGFSFSTSKY